MDKHRALAAMSSHPQFFGPALATLGATQIALLQQQAIDNHATVVYQASQSFLPSPGRLVNMRGGPLVVGGTGGA